MYQTRLLFQYTKELTQCDSFNDFIEPNMMDIVTYIDHNGKEASYAGSDIYYIYYYIDIYRATTNLTYSVQNSHYSLNNQHRLSIHVSSYCSTKSKTTNHLWVLWTTTVQVLILQHHRRKKLTYNYPYK